MAWLTLLAVSHIHVRGLLNSTRVAICPSTSLFVTNSVHTPYRHFLDTAKRKRISSLLDLGLHFYCLLSVVTCSSICGRLQLRIKQLGWESVHQSLSQWFLVGKNGLPTLEWEKSCFLGQLSSSISYWSNTHRNGDAGLVCCVKKHRGGGALLIINLMIYVLTYGHELWPVTDRIRLHIHAAKISFLWRMVEPTLSVRVKSSVVREGKK